MKQTLLDEELDFLLSLLVCVHEEQTPATGSLKALFSLLETNLQRVDANVGSLSGFTELVLEVSASCLSVKSYEFTVGEAHEVLLEVGHRPHEMETVGEQRHAHICH